LKVSQDNSFQSSMAAIMAQENINASEDLFDARPSNRIGNVQVEADGDTWQETLAVCEAPPAARADAGKLVIRSYYQNSRSGQRVWDEPPSGASNILPATEEMRKMANLQLSELHVVTGGVPDSNEPTPPTKTKKKRGLFGFGKKKDKSPKEDSRNIQYRPGSKMFSKKGNSPRVPTGEQNNDAQLQEAIARSLAESQGIPYVESKAPPAMDDEELAMAKAISLSYAEDNGETEEQILMRVMKESKEGAAGAKRGGGRPKEHDLLGLSAPPAPWPQDDRKMAPKPGNEPPPLDRNAQSNYAASSPTALYAAAAAAPLKSPSASASQNPPSQSPGSIFDPYAKDSPAAKQPIAKKAPPPARQDSGPTLQKMEETANANARLTFGKRKSTQKMQDKAGVV
jgi:hypothetical protein